MRKLEGNRARDEKIICELRGQGWRVATVWECAMRGRSARDVIQMTARLANG